MTDISTVVHNFFVSTFKTLFVCMYIQLSVKVDTSQMKLDLVLEAVD